MQYLIIILFTFALYFKTIKHGLVVDDNVQYTRMNKLRKRPECFILEIFYGSGLFKTHKYDHLFKISLTAIIGILIYANFNNLLASLIWIASPMNNQLNCWLNGRRYQVSLVLGLLSYKFVFLGILLFPFALWIHPIALPLLFVKIFYNYSAFFWILPCLLFIPKHYDKWIERRFKIQNHDPHKEFSPGKIIMSFKILARYWFEAIVPTGFNMFNEHYYGLELEGRRIKLYKLNLSFYVSIAFLIAIHVLTWFIDRSCFLWAILADLALLQWLGTIINPVQLYAQRYSALFMVFFALWISAILPQTILLLWLGFNIAITFKDLNMYQGPYQYYLYHCLNYPKSFIAHYKGIGSMEQSSKWFSDNSKPVDGIMCSVFSLVIAFLWAMENKERDEIHAFIEKRIS